MRRAKVSLTMVMVARGKRWHNIYTMGYLPVRGDNPQALATNAVYFIPPLPTLARIVPPLPTLARNIS